MTANRLLIIIALLTVCGSAWAAVCPDGLPLDGDQDLDGIPNDKDPCCFVASPGDLTDEVCNFSDEERDLNYNGVSGEDEGRCCVFVKNGLCKNYGGDAACMEEAGVPVDCDVLLWYLHMPLLGEGDSPSEASCEGEDCICYVVGDPDKDGNPSAPNVDDEEVDTDEPFDRCPTVAVEEEDAGVGDDDEEEDKEDGEEDLDGGVENPDSDLWASECDLCPETPQPSEICELSGTDCPPPSFCIPYVFPELEGGMRIENHCSGIGDKDSDGVGDPCDNCPELENRGQADRDADGFGDSCDLCPHRADDQLVVGSDRDSDGIADKCDNCLHLENPKQQDSDHDGVGDLCTPINDYLGGGCTCLVGSGESRAGGELGLLILQVI